MKQLLLLCSLVFSFCSVSVAAQSLDRTSWITYDHMFGTGSKYFRFHSDTSYYSLDKGTSYVAFATYHTNGNKYWTLGLPGTKCDADTGFYEFAIQNDTLVFTLVSDNCEFTRSEVHTVFVWVRMRSSDVSSEQTTESPLVVQRGTTLEFQTADVQELRVYSINGNCVQQCNHPARVYPLTDLEAGVYMVVAQRQSAEAPIFMKIKILK